MAHYNTTHESSDKLEEYGKQTATQDNRVACFFESNPGEIYTPWEIQSLVFGQPGKPPTPITSIRRSMSDLTKVGILTKTEHQKEAGTYGRRSYAWTLNESYRESLRAMDDISDPGLTWGEIVDKVLGDPIKAAQDPPEEPQEEIHPKEVGEDQIHGKSRNEPKKSPQRKLFNFEDDPLDPIYCAICGRELKAGYSRKMGVGPVCAGKCLTDVLKKEKHGLG